ncbi:MAG TPA: phage/plasmid primase, P4 family [Ktedonobacterales bacterium]
MPKDAYTAEDARSTYDSVKDTPPRDLPGVNGHIPASGQDGPIAGRALWNAQYFVSRYQDRLRYIAKFNRWYEYNGKWWEPDDVRIAVRLGYDAVDALYQQAVKESDRAKKADFASLAKTLDDTKKIHAMVTDASTFTPIAATPDQFDQHDWHVVAANGVIDLRTGKLLPHNPAAFHSRHLGPTSASIAYDPQATCPRFLEFLSTIFPEVDGGELVAYLRRVAGYTLTGSTREQCVFFLVGDGSNGKTTFTQAISDVLGTYSGTVPPESLLASAHDRIPNDLAKLVGVRGVFTSENEQHQRLAEARIKAITGGEPIDARFMRQDFFTYTPKFKIWLHTNYAPKLRGQDRGIRRRIRIVPFNYTILDEQKDADFYEHVIRPELPGILSWMVQGALEWQRDGLREPQRVLNAAKGYFEANDLIGQFLGENVYHEEGAFLPSATVYSAYSRWAQQQGEPAETQAKLSREIHARFGVETTMRNGVGRGFPGLFVQEGRGMNRDPDVESE